MKYRKNLFYKIISTLLVLLSFWFLGVLAYMDLLPTRYLLMIFFAVIIFDILSVILINLKSIKKKFKRTIAVFIIFAILIMIMANFFIGRTLGVLNNNVDSKYKLVNYSIVVLDESEYKEISDIKGKTVGYFENSTGINDANKDLNDKVDVILKAYKTSDALVHDLLDKKVDVIIIEDSIKSIMEEELPEFKNLCKVIYSFSIEIKVENILKEVDVTQEPFAVYISGIDTYGEISSVSRSDVNMVMLVNPKIRQVLLISIPRDYYVQLHGTAGNKDKLTHAGIYGIDMSIRTIEDLLDVDINYYIKVNFTSVIDIVDSLGALDVYSEYSFISYSGFKFKEGFNRVNGEQALDFARTRKAFVEGDRQRGKNQQALIKAMIDKVTDKTIITKYNSLLSAVDGKYQTNMSTKKITSLIKSQLDDMSPWSVTSYSLTGSDAKDYTYTYGQLLYVMKPDENSLSEAKNLIEQVINGENLENSYIDLDGPSNNVVQVQINTPQDPTVDSENNQESLEFDTPLQSEELENQENSGDENEDNNSENIDSKNPDNNLDEEEPPNENSEPNENEKQEESLNNGNDDSNTNETINNNTENSSESTNLININ